jgi:CBS-domain-containing membrane protein
MRVDEIMTKQVSCCRPDSTLAEAAQLMWDNDCGCLPVCRGHDGNRVVGIITDRDICMSALFTGRPLYELRVFDAMSRQVQTCRPGDSLTDVERIMRTARVRRLPVVDEQGLLVGMISLADLAREAARLSHLEAPDLTETDVGETLAAICQPAARQQLAA